jgi:SAM-dependent methyltransferase
MNGSHYFYTGADAVVYDDTIRMTDRAYDLVHEATIRALDFWLAHCVRNQSSKAPLWVLDVGCGTGAEAMQILLQIPDSHVLCIDHSPTMLSRFKEKVGRAYGSVSADGRLSFCEADFREIGWLDRAVSELNVSNPPATFAAAVSVYALHHLQAEEKASIYKALYKRLQLSSCFINADLFSFSTDWVSSLAQEEEERWISQQFSDKTSKQGLIAATLGPSRHRLKDSWIQHVRTENHPLPIRSGGKEQPCEEGLLKNAGFHTVEVPLRLYQSGVLVALK